MFLIFKNGEVQEFEGTQRHKALVDAVAVHEAYAVLSLDFNKYGGVVANWIKTPIDGKEFPRDVALEEAIAQIRLASAHSANKQEQTVETNGAEVERKVEYKQQEEKVIEGRVFKNISTEIERTYIMSGKLAPIIVKEPLWLNVNERDNHRLICDDGQSIYIPRATENRIGWVAISIKVKPGASPWSF